jgi:hypothetical protein
MHFLDRETAAYAFPEIEEMARSHFPSGEIACMAIVKRAASGFMSTLPTTICRNQYRT